MKLRNGKKYETADGVVVGPMKGPDAYGDYSALVGENELIWNPDGTRWAKGVCGDLIRRHYKKPKPAHRLDLKQGDVVELVEWEDGHGAGIGEKITIGKDGKPDHDFYKLNGWNKGQRPLFRVVSRA